MNSGKPLGSSSPPPAPPDGTDRRPPQDGAEPAGQPAPDPPPPSRKRRGRWRRKLLLALGSFLFTLLLFEVAARFMMPRWAPVRLRDGLYGNTLPLSTGLVAPNFRDLPVGERLPESKPEGQLRVFVFGESSVVGVPFGLSASPPTMLYDLLREAYPERDVVVVNMGRSGSIATNTYYHLLLVRRYEPDVIIFYLGGNDDPHLEGEQCAAVRHPGWHAVWRTMVEHSALLWTVRSLGPPLLWASDGGQPGTGKPGQCPTTAFPQWAEILVEVARGTGAQVIVTTPVKSPASAIETVESGFGRERLDVASLPAEYRQVLACRLSADCDFRAVLGEALSRPDGDAGDSDGRRRRSRGAGLEGRLAALGSAWRAAAERHGADFVDFRRSLAAASPDGTVTDAHFSDEIHLTLVGYQFLARHWLERVRPLLGGGAPGTPALPTATEVERYLAGTSAPARSMYSSYLRRSWILSVVTGLETTAAEAGAADAEWAQLTLGFLRKELGLDPGLGPALEARLEGFDPLASPR